MARKFNHKPVRKHRPLETISLSARDEKDKAKVNGIISRMHARSRADCVVAGKIIIRMLDRLEIGKQATSEFVTLHFGDNADYVRRFVKLVIDEPLLADADALRETLKWYNKYQYEPDRSLNLLRWFKKKTADTGTEGATLRIPITAYNDDATDSPIQVLNGDCRVRLCGLPSKSAKACVTSPPYWFMRDYGVECQIGLEPTIKKYVGTLVQDVFREVYRILDDRGVLIVNLADRHATRSLKVYAGWGSNPVPSRPADPLRPGNLLGIPWLFARAMQDAGWIWRQVVVWNKMRSTHSSTSIPVVTHEYLFMFTKSMRNDYYADAVQVRRTNGKTQSQRGRQRGALPVDKATKHINTVWYIPSVPRAGDNAAFPEELVRRLLLLMTKDGDRILDPFGGTGTVGVVAKALGRYATLIEANPGTAAKSRQRIASAPDKARAKAIEAMKRKKRFQEARSAIQKLFEDEDRLSEGWLIRVADALRNISPASVIADADDDEAHAEAAE
jgi:site-specific DNA-methyltransferase (cytosine-N4-specific)